MVRSYLGQPLVADIELGALADPAVPVTVRLAHADVYRGANIAMHPILGSLTMSVMRRDGRQFLHITSVKPVNSDYLHLFLDLVEGNRRNVRTVTLWLTPDPTPAPPAPRPLPAPVAVAAPVAPPAPVAPAAPVAPPVARNVSRNVPEPPVAVERPRPARVLNLPSAPASCPQPRFTEEQIKSCAAIDYKNGLLSAQIVELEEKVKQLQVAIEGKFELPVPAAAEKAAPPPPPPPARRVPKPTAGFPWLLAIGALVLLAAIGGGVWFMLSRRKGKSVETAAADSVAWYARLTRVFKRKPKAVPAAAPEAPSDA